MNLTLGIQRPTADWQPLRGSACSSSTDRSSNYFKTTSSGPWNSPKRRCNETQTILRHTTNSVPPWHSWHPTRRRSGTMAFVALRDARRAYGEHQRVLELDPNRKDANFTLGVYRYLVSLLPRPVRMMAYLVGFDGGHDEAIRLVEEAAAYPGDTQSEARFALVSTTAKRISTRCRAS